jgi:opacity protein-like surface antigen
MSMHSSLRMSAAAGFLMVCAVFGSIANAQEKKPQAPPPKPVNTGPRATLIGPLSLGFRMGFAVGQPVTGENSTTTDTARNPDRTTQISGTSNSGHVGWGPTLQLNFTQRISLNVDLLRSSVGYNATTTVNDEATDTQAAKFVSQRAERVTAKFWDLNILPRYRFGKPGKPRPYLTAGVAMRSLSKERGSAQTTDSNGVVDTADFSVPSSHSVVRGGVVGAGIQVHDDVGFKFELEGRYTRWFQRTFETDAVNSKRNQIEILVGLTF